MDGSVKDVWTMLIFLIMLVAATALFLWLYKKTNKRPLNVELKKAGAELRRRQFQEEYKRQHKGKTSAAYYNACKKADRLKMSNYIVLDTETTGLSPKTDKLIEVAAMRIEGGQITGQYHTLINPGCLIPREITKITGISTKDILLAPILEKVAPKLGEFIEGYPVIAHNAVFHVQFLTAAFRQEGVYGRISYIDTLELAREAFPNLESYKLEDLIEVLHLPPVSLDSPAMTHAKYTYLLYGLCRKKLLCRT